MLRTFMLMIYSLFSLFAAYPAIAQSYPNLPSRINVSSSARTLRVGQLTEIRIALIDQQGQETAALQRTPITLIGTRLKDLSSAKGDAHAGKVLPDGVFELPFGSISSVQWSIAIPRGHTAAAVKFRSQQSGTIRIFAESEKLVAGSTLIAVLRESSGRSAAQASVFRTVSFQEEPALPSYSISLESDGSEVPPIINREWVRKLTVELRSNGELVQAIEPVKVRLNTRARLSKKEVIIPPGEASSEEIELRTSIGGEIEVMAEVVYPSRYSIGRVRSTIPFPSAKRATKLLVDALPPTALANGLEAIQLRVRAVDDGNNPIRAEDEGLAAREVIFRLEGQALGLKFDKGVTKVTIPKDEVAAVINIFGSSPIDGTKVIAESENGSGAAINGATKVAFSFLWWQLGCAILGGLLVPLVRKQWSANMKLTDQATSTLIRNVLFGATVGGLFFALIFFGAATVDGLTLRGITINPTRLPIYNVAAAFIIGVLGSLLIDMRSFFATTIARATSKMKPAGA